MEREKAINMVTMPKNANKFDSRWKINNKLFK